MSSADIAALITALGVAVGALIGSIAALMNARTNKHEQEELKEELGAATKRITELEAHRVTDRESIIMIGNSLAQAREDNAVLAEAFNKVWQEFNEVTGHKPTVDLDMLKRLHQIRYITGRLNPLDIEQ